MFVKTCIQKSKPTVEETLKLVKQSDFVAIEIDYQFKTFKIHSIEKRIFFSNKPIVKTIYF